jgi:hypothetical protein
MMFAKFIDIGPLVPLPLLMVAIAAAGAQLCIGKGGEGAVYEIVNG